MPPELDDTAIVANALIEKVRAFAASQPKEVFSKLVGFFHLADPLGAAEIQLSVDPDGRVALHIASSPLPRGD